jgi:hypothetical protein
MRKKKKPTARKRGGQAGNKNALRHGFYSKGFTADENKRLDRQDSIDIVSEIELLRVCLDRLQKELDFAENSHTDKDGNTSRDDHYLKQLNTLALMTQSLSTLARTHYLIRGRSGDIHDTILNALEELRLELGL